MKRVLTVQQDNILLSDVSNLLQLALWGHQSVTSFSFPIISQIYPSLFLQVSCSPECPFLQTSSKTSNRKGWTCADVLIRIYITRQTLGQRNRTWLVTSKTKSVLTDPWPADVEITLVASSCHARGQSPSCLWALIPFSPLLSSLKLQPEPSDPVNLTKTAFWAHSHTQLSAPGAAHSCSSVPTHRSDFFLLLTHTEGKLSSAWEKLRSQDFKWWYPAISHLLPYNHTNQQQTRWKKRDTPTCHSIHEFFHNDSIQRHPLSLLTATSTNPVQEQK